MERVSKPTIISLQAGVILKGSFPTPLTHTTPSMGAFSPPTAGLVPSHREELCSNDLPQDSCLELCIHSTPMRHHKYLPLPALPLRTVHVCDLSTCSPNKS